MLSREFGCQAAYTPMFHAAQFAQSKKYRQKYFSTCPEDRPLIVQFCANNAQTLLEAAKHVENKCDGIDINLGCPQEIAKRGRYGAFLQDDWDLIGDMVRILRNNLRNDLAVSCKIRRFDELDKTIDYAKMLEKSGCSFVGVHGRTREQRGCNTGLADWTFIKAVKNNLNIPVVANGNIQSLDDADRCLLFTGADAIMTAEGNLYNPCVLQNIHPPAWKMAAKYLDYIKLYPIPAGMAKSHIFKLFHKCVSMDENLELRSRLGQSTTIEQLYDVINCFEEKYRAQDDCDQSLPICTLPVPPYLCQSRYRYDVIGPPKSRNDTNGTDEPVDSDQRHFGKRIKLDNQKEG